MPDWQSAGGRLARGPNGERRAPLGERLRQLHAAHPQQFLAIKWASRRPPSGATHSLARWEPRALLAGDIYNSSISRAVEEGKPLEGELRMASSEVRGPKRDFRSAPHKLQLGLQLELRLLLARQLSS